MSDTPPEYGGWEQQADGKWYPPQAERPVEVGDSVSQNPRQQQSAARPAVRIARVAAPTAEEVAVARSLGENHLSMSLYAVAVLDAAFGVIAGGTEIGNKNTALGLSYMIASVVSGLILLAVAEVLTFSRASAVFAIRSRVADKSATSASDAA